VWAWYPDADINFAMMLRIAQGTETTKPASGASTKETVKTIAQGRPERFGEPVVYLLVCFLLFAYEAAGALEHPAFPRPRFLSRAIAI
jgi:hypothetical protein